MTLAARKMTQPVGTGSTVSVRLLGGFAIEASGVQVDLPSSSARVVAYLAVHDRPVSRHVTAGTLWPESSEAKANGSLRSALWRIRRLSTDLVAATDEYLGLAQRVMVDVRVLVDLSSQLRGEDGPGADAPRVADLHALELLPDWYDDWVAFERERFRLIALHVLEGLSEWHVRRGSYMSAEECAIAAIRIEPLRESSHRTLMAAHIAQGNYSEAAATFESFRTLLQHELGVAPSHHMERLLASIDSKFSVRTTSSRSSGDGGQAAGARSLGVTGPRYRLE